MSVRRFLSRILGRNTDEDETRIYPLEELGKRTPRQKHEDEPQGFSIERAAKIIVDLPPDVPRESAVRIMRGTLTAAGIEVEDIERVARTQESQLNSEIDLARSRQKDLRERTEEVMRSLEEEIRKAREAHDTSISEEEE